MTTRRPRVFTIPASAPFLRTLIEALRNGTLVEGFPASTDPLALAAATLYLPTRRACRLAREVFLDVTGTNAAILPRIVPLGDIDEDEIAFAQSATPGDAALDLPDALGGLERRLLLAQLVSKWAESPEVRRAGHAPLVANTPASALMLADALARLMDDMITRKVSWNELDELVPQEHDEYWQLTLRFLKIAREAWPAMCDERKKIEPAARRDALIAAEAKRLAGASGPVIAAGSTGSMPATAELIATIATLPHGAVVLPGLDADLDDESWALIAGKHDAEGNELIAPAIGHPQFAMQALLKRIGIGRSNVRCLGKPAAHARERLVSEALRPAALTDRWSNLSDTLPMALREGALKDVSVVAAANAEEEALAIAVALRETAEDAGKTAALVTPDRALARRVLAALERWKVAVDDSGGDALSDTAAGTFARLAADAALQGLEPVTLLALLKHPLTRLAAAEGAHTHAIATLEMAVLRGPRPKPGAAGLAHALATFRAELAKLRRKGPSALHHSEPRAHLADAALDAAAGLVTRLTAALKPLETLPRQPQRLTAIAAAHRMVIDALSGESGTGLAFAGHDGKALALAFEDIAENADDTRIAISTADYPELFRAILAERVVRRPGRPGVRVRIYGPLEARLQSVDRVVLGGLVEGVWPPETRSDPWLSRPMRRELGLDLPERRISLSAHDFAQMLGAGEVVLAYPAKLSGTPTVQSRFVQRLAAVSGEAPWNEATRRGERYLHWARELDRPSEIKRLPRPAPKPPIEARPLKLSVTDIENWVRDPYTIYAKHILKLRDLDPVDLAPGVADRGIFIHGAIGDFTKAYARGLPDDPERALVEIGREQFKALADYPEAIAFWWPRFLRIARWFAGWEKDRRAQVSEITAETSGELNIPIGERTFTLRAIADRIERRADGRYAILDYKTGTVPTEKQVRIGLSPQLTLEAAILRGGGFKEIAAGASVAELVYVSLKGGEPAGKAGAIAFKDGDANSQADKARDKLQVLASKFELPDQAYLPMVLPMWASRYGAYDHLARVKEWSVSGDETEGGT